METKAIKTSYLRSENGKIHLIIVALFLAALLSTAYLHNINDYMRYRDVNVTVVGHQTGRYQTLYLIVQNEEWGVFEIIVNPATYNTAKKGDLLCFNLRESDIKQTPRKNVIYFFLPPILWAVTAVLGITSLIFPIIFRNSKEGGGG